MPTDFSYERDVAPAAGRFFNQVSSDPRLTAADRAEVQGTLLNGAQDIEQTRLKLQDERDNGRMNQLRLSEGISALADARAKRARMEQQQQQVGTAQGIVQGIVSGTDSPSVKAQKLAEAELSYGQAAATNPDVSQIFQIGQKAVPRVDKPLISNAQNFTAILKGIPPEILQDANATGDFSHVAKAAQAIDDNHAAVREGVRLKHSEEADAKKAKDELANAKLQFAKDPESKEPTPWLDDASTLRAGTIVHALGDDEDIKQFEALKTSPDDRARALLVQKVQLRHQLHKITGGAAAPKKGLTASDITGLGD